ACGSNGRSRASLVVVLNDGTEIERGEQIAIENQCAAFAVGQPRKRSGSTERCRFMRVLDIEPPVLPFPEVGLNDSGQMANCESHLSESLFGKLPQQNLKNRILANRYERLRKNGRVWL